MTSSLIRQSLIDQGGTFKVSGYSMFPSLLPGRCVQVEKLRLDELKTGDIILTEIDQQFRIHRLLRPIEEGQFQTGGDFCRFADSFQKVSHIVGRMVEPRSSLLSSLVKRFTLWRFNL